MSPSLGKGIGLGYVSTPFKSIGTELNIEIRGRKKNATVVKAPFYTKGSLLA
jgi:aminomethyltransferase